MHPRLRSFIGSVAILGTHDPLTPSQVRYQAALRSDIGERFF